MNPLGSHARLTINRKTTLIYKLKSITYWISYLMHIDVYSLSMKSRQTKLISKTTSFDLPFSENGTRNIGVNKLTESLFEYKRKWAQSYRLLRSFILEKWDLPRLILQEINRAKLKEEETELQQDSDKFLVKSSIASFQVNRSLQEFVVPLCHLNITRTTRWHVEGNVHIQISFKLIPLNTYTNDGTLRFGVLECLLIFFFVIILGISSKIILIFGQIKPYCTRDF